MWLATMTLVNISPLTTKYLVVKVLDLQEAPHPQSPNSMYTHTNYILYCSLKLVVSFVGFLCFKLQQIQNCWSTRWHISDGFLVHDQYSLLQEEYQNEPFWTNKCSLASIATWSFPRALCMSLSCSVAFTPPVACYVLEIRAAFSLNAVLFLLLVRSRSTCIIYCVLE